MFILQRVVSIDEILQSIARSCTKRKNCAHQTERQDIIHFVLAIFTMCLQRVFRG